MTTTTTTMTSRPYRASSTAIPPGEHQRWAGCTVRYITWKRGWRRPVLTTHVETGCRVAWNGSGSCIVTLPSGAWFSIKIHESGFSVRDNTGASVVFA